MTQKISRRMDELITARFLRLLEQPFSTWEAFSLGYIDSDGRILKRTYNKTWTKFHQVTSQIKRMLDRNSSNEIKLSMLHKLYKNLKEEVELDDKQVAEHNSVLEAVVAGDSGGSAMNIASGKNSGCAVGGVTSKTKKKKKKGKKKAMKEFVGFGEFCAMRSKMNEQQQGETQIEENVEKNSEKYILSALGGNSVVLEAVNGSVTDVCVSGYTTALVDSEKLLECFSERHTEGVLEYLNETTDRSWYMA